MKSSDIALHDIQPLMEVNEYSLYFLVGYIALAMLFLAVLVYILYCLYKRRKRVNIRKQYKEAIESLNLDETKKTAYMISSYGVFFKDDSPQHQEIYEDLTKRLSQYKYKKNIEAFDSETLECIQMYKGMLNV